MRLVVVSGLSGGGKSVALHMLEDIGYFCIDNIPINLLKSFVAETVMTDDPAYRRMAVGIDARSNVDDLLQLPALVEEIRAGGVDCDILFLHADQHVLLKRFRETRRKHPLSNDQVGLQDAIRRENEILESVAAYADLVIDTSRTSVHELREIVRDRIDSRGEGRLSLQFQSFGFKNGLPADADIVFDVRCLPNPYWVAELRGKSGQDEPVARWLGQQDDVNDMLESISDWLARWIPAFVASNRSYLTVAIGCTGGQHRSVYLVERLAERFGDGNVAVLIRHNELKH
ncbi:MAG: RNase adapter RapZ [Gammaproteobacteria bacterium]|nr:RNase adapter RapZ [Gammaproteobacteria bacterium]NND59584.1 RNase adapter RapZ [Gammaproteobacteria bacterium]